MQEANAKVHYLVDNIIVVGASSNVDMNATEDVQPKAAENTPNNASTTAVEDVDKDAGESTRELTYPYSVLTKEVAPSLESSLVPSVRQATP